MLSVCRALTQGWGDGVCISCCYCTDSGSSILSMSVWCWSPHSTCGKKHSVHVNIFSPFYETIHIHDLSCRNGKGATSGLQDRRNLQFLDWPLGTGFISECNFSLWNIKAKTTSPRFSSSSIRFKMSLHKFYHRLDFNSFHLAFLQRCNIQLL